MDFPYFLVTAPSGVGLTRFIENCKCFFGDENIGYCDIDEHLKTSVITNEELKKIDLNIDNKDEINMNTITWSLPAEKISELWNTAAKQSIYELSLQKKRINFITFHSIYYLGMKNIFFSPIQYKLFTQSSGKPKAVILLIDDIDSVYANLTKPGAIFDLEDTKNKYKKICCDFKRNPSDEIIDLECRLSICNQIIFWRSIETILAEHLAKELDVRLFCLGVKQNIKIIMNIFENDILDQIYLSHHISLFRRSKSDEADWQKEVFQINNFAEKMIVNGINCISPTAIDELRFKCSSTNSKIPDLKPRWPYFCSEKDMIVFNPNKDDMLCAFASRDYAQQKDRVDSLIGKFENEIVKQVSSRDHLLVNHANGIIIFRPFCIKGQLSDGVKAELHHLCIRANNNYNLKIAYIHFEEDLGTLFSINEDKHEELFYDLINKEIENELQIVSHSQKPRNYYFGQKSEKATILNAGINPNQRVKIIEKREKIVKNALKILNQIILKPMLYDNENKKNYLAMYWIAKDDNELNSYICDISSFFKNTTNENIDQYLAKQKMFEPEFCKNIIKDFYNAFTSET